LKRVSIISIVFLLISSILVGCTEKKDSTKDDGKLTVYTTVYPLQYFTERIAGDLVSVETIYPPGADEHTFEPSQKDMMNVADADMFIYIGLGLEGFVEKAKTTLKSEDVQFLPVGEQINIETAGHEEDMEHEEEEGHHHEHGDVDPHIWLDPIYAEEIAKTIKEELIAQLPDEEKTFEDNYQLLSKDFKELDSSFQNTMETAKQKEVIVSHAAFGYWELRYGLKQISISGISSATEPSQKELEEIVKKAKDQQIKYILFEQNVSSKLGEIIQHEIGAKPLRLHNLSTLTEENIENNETYFTLMNQNIKSISTALNQ
jgi:zinc transport system substrate-binding protein